MENPLLDTASPFPEGTLLMQEAMLFELKNCCGLISDREQQLKTAIQIAKAFRARFLLRVRTAALADRASEIRFFKQTLPLFEAEEEYYRRCYQAWQRGKEGLAFSHEELLRTEELLAAHQDFSTYYHHGQSHMDGLWFRAGQLREPSALCLNRQDHLLRYSSLRGSWVGGLLGAERYRLELLSRLTEENE